MEKYRSYRQSPVTSPSSPVGSRDARVYMKAEDHQLQIRKLKEGDRFCIQCGLVAVSAVNPLFMVRCRPCYAMKKDALYCRHCGEEIDRNQRDVAKRAGGEAKQCWLCSQNGTQKHSACGFKHPSHWHCSTSLPPKS